MSKRHTPTLALPKVGRLRKFVPLLVLAALLWWITRDPHTAAHTATAIGRGLADAASAVGTFVRSL